MKYFATSTIGLDRRFAGRPAADVINDFPDGDSHRDFNQADVFDFADEAEDFGAGVVFRSHLGKLFGALADDDGDVGPGFDVVDYGGLAVDPFLHRIGRPLARLAALPFDRPDQRRFLAAAAPVGRRPAR